MNKALLSGFAAPSSEYRGAPFWAWNGKLEPEELKRQIRVMHEMGLGGFFMHSRVGLDTPYLSEEWYECVQACIDEAEKLDMQAWLYDEDRWPSGAAGGLVTSNPEYRAKEIVAEEITEPAKLIINDDTLAIYICRLEGINVSAVEKLQAVPAEIHPSETLLHFYVKANECSSWYNGQTYLDTLNHDAVKKFIEVTHEDYKKNIEEHFGKRVPGIFTDEPNYGRVCLDIDANKCSSPWTQKLQEVFLDRYGYDILDHLVELFYDVEGVELSKARLNYIDCITHLFVDAFARQIGEWCDDNDMLHTGHVLEEDSLSHQTNCVGNCMRFYEYMQAPGMDLLTERWKVYDTAKQVSSAANQFNRKWRLTETYGCTGWDFPFLGHKALGDWQAALGINLRAQHLSWYTMEGQAKRDYPASIFYQSPWYQQYSKVEDYFGRINLAMTQGVEVRDLLVIYPVESAWTTIKKGWKESDFSAKLDTQMINLRDSLLEASIDFDYGDEDIMSRHGSVLIENGTPVLKIAQAEYKTVVVPELITVRKSTLELLKKFKDVGGQVIFIGSPATYVDGDKSNCAAELSDSCENISTPDEKLIDVVSSARRISITDENGKQINQALYLLREDGDSTYLFICNTGHPETEEVVLQNDILARDRKESFPKVKVELKTSKGCNLLELDPETGDIYQADAEKTQEGWLINTSLDILGSRLFVSTDSTESYQPRPRLSTVSKTALQKSSGIILSEDNVLPLDRAKYSINGEELKHETYILHVDHEVRKSIGIQPRGGQMVQPWARDKSDIGETSDVMLSYEFFCDAIPSGALFLGIERPELYEIYVNGNQLSADSDSGWWCDKSLRKLPLSPMFIKQGRNEIVLKCKYNKLHPGLEAIFLLGNFGVIQDDLKLTVTNPAQTLSLGDWGKQGLPFYSGSVGYKFDIDFAPANDEKAFIKLNEYRGVCAKIIVNGQEAGILAWAPNELDISGYIQDAKTEIIVEMFGSRRNSHGPLYMEEDWPSWTGPGQYEQFTSEYSLVPCGIIDAPELLIKI
jgi:alpha-L-rhamnosidase